MFKKITAFLILVLCLILPLSGCSLFALDSYTYLNQTVVTINNPSNNNQLVIKKKDLIEAYRNYAQTLQQNGYTGQQAIEQIVQLLINKEVVLNEAERLIEEEEITVSNNDLNDMWTETYKAVIKNIADFENEIIKAWGLHIPSVLTEEEADENVYFEQYKAQAEIVKITNPNNSVEWKIRSLESQNDFENELIYEFGKHIDSIFNEAKNRVSSTNVTKEALKRYIKLLKSNEKGLNLSTEDNDVFKREVERIYNNIKENKYMQLYSEYFEVKNGYSIISVNQVLNYLSAQMLASYSKYSIDFDLYESDILSNRENAWYIMDDNYFYVSHILLSFSDEEKASITEAEESYKAGEISYQDYENVKQSVAENVIVKEYGENTNLTPNQLLNSLKTNLNGKDKAGKVEVLNDYIYKYSGDGGNKNATYEYIVGENNSQMVEEFTNAARELHNNGNGKFGDLSDLVVTEYGVHILVYLEPVENAFTIHSANNFSLTTGNTEEMENIIETLTTTKLSQLNERTLFDYIYEKLLSDKFSSFEGMNLSILKQNLDIKIYNKNYADLF